MNTMPYYDDGFDLTAPPTPDPLESGVNPPDLVHDAVWVGWALPLSLLLSSAGVIGLIWLILKLVK